MRLLTPAWLRRYEAYRPMTPGEAWAVWRLAAIAEAVGWTMLISAIVWRHLDPYIGAIAVTVAGRLHGALFVTYLLACLLLYPSLGWSRWQMLVAGIMANPPYGSLAFERFESARKRRRRFGGFLFLSTTVQAHRSSA